LEANAGVVFFATANWRAGQVRRSIAVDLLASAAGLRLLLSEGGGRLLPHIRD
jgi:hypothetical protein